MAGTLMVPILHVDVIFREGTCLPTTPPRTRGAFIFHDSPQLPPCTFNSLKIHNARVLEYKKALATGLSNNNMRFLLSSALAGLVASQTITRTVTLCGTGQNTTTPTISVNNLSVQTGTNPVVVANEVLANVLYTNLNIVYAYQTIYSYSFTTMVFGEYHVLDGTTSVATVTNSVVAAAATATQSNSGSNSFQIPAQNAIVNGVSVSIPAQYFVYISTVSITIIYAPVVIISQGSTITTQLPTPTVNPVSSPILSSASNPSPTSSPIGNLSSFVLASKFNSTLQYITISNGQLLFTYNASSPISFMVDKGTHLLANGTTVQVQSGTGAMLASSLVHASNKTFSTGFFNAGGNLGLSQAGKHYYFFKCQGGYIRTSSNSAALSGCITANLLIQSINTTSVFSTSMGIPTSYVNQTGVLSKSMGIPASYVNQTTKSINNSTGSSTVLGSSVMTSVTTSSSPTASTQLTSDQVQAQSLVAINSLRSAHGANNVSVNANLVALAAGMANNCDYDVSTVDGNIYGATPALGQAGTSISAIVSTDPDSWANQEQYYKYLSPGYYSDAATFTQLVWKSTTQVGCAINSQCSAQPGDGNTYPIVFLCFWR
ncbi:Protein PRY1 [Neolecta irregularis DAH-3]|uniref:Protein PRY1 n=1 Tax=Neolecta irregularis (strain DAH-3) TaxID=1198029 RepID=A0A1U7LNB3_NEOID|nr:Protein PRY1 [Neolecta irregularis DAH-3]|eukprot:OLL24160.1 Protein PRY1 [Neolecta irregularis DAH-3]